MFDDIEIRYYRESDIFFSEKKDIINYMYYVPKFLTNILGVEEDFLSTELCHPYSGEEDIFDYDRFKNDREYLKDKLVIVAIKNNKVVGICIYTIFNKFIYLKLFCIERIIRKKGFSRYFLNLSINLLRNNYNLPLILISTTEGYNLYKKQGFKDIKYDNIKRLDPTRYLEWVSNSNGRYIGKYLMKYYDKTSNKIKNKRSRKLTKIR